MTVEKVLPKTLYSPSRLRQAFVGLSYKLDEIPNYWLLSVDTDDSAMVDRRLEDAKIYPFTLELVDDFVCSNLDLHCWEPRAFYNIPPSGDYPSEAAAGSASILTDEHGGVLRLQVTPCIDAHATHNHHLTLAQGALPEGGNNISDGVLRHFEMLRGFSYEVRFRLGQLAGGNIGHWYMGMTSSLYFPTTGATICYVNATDRFTALMFAGVTPEFHDFTITPDTDWHTAVVMRKPDAKTIIASVDGEEYEFTNPDVVYDGFAAANSGLCSYAGSSVEKIVDLDYIILRTARYWGTKRPSEILG